MKIYIVDLEAVDTRYTGQWKNYVPELLRNNNFEVEVIEGPKDIPPATSPGAFLNFGGTNIYKSAQVQKIAEMFCKNEIQPGDHFLFTDAWHPGIINLKYMSQLLNIPVTIHALWHAGSYDPADFLGRLIGDTPWVRYAEKSFFHAIDHNYFATDFHIDMFVTNLFGPWYDAEAYEEEDTRLGAIAYHKKVKKIIRTGWPMAYMPDTLAPYKNLPKRDLIVFPHRIAPEKQVEIFRDLASHLPQFEFVVCQDKHLTKHEYHTLLGEAKMVFSASLQETLGIGCYEGAIVGALPFVPDRLSYSEMYFYDFKYPSNWTESWDAYLANRSSLVELLDNQIFNYDEEVLMLEKQTELLTKNFFSADGLVDNFKELAQRPK